MLLEFETYHTATVTGTTVLVQGLINQSNRTGCKYRPTHKRWIFWTKAPRSTGKGNDSTNDAAMLR